MAEKKQSGAAPVEGETATEQSGGAQTLGVTVENGGDAPKTYGGPGDGSQATSGDNGAAPATEFLPSGAPDQVVADVDPSHPAVDNDPRANATADQNRIDFNDPTLSGAEAVERNLADQAQD